MFFAQNMSNLGAVLNKPLQLKRVTKGAEPPPAGDFCDFAAKIAILTPFKSHLASFKAISIFNLLIIIDMILKRAKKSAKNFKTCKKTYQ